MLIVDLKLSDTTTKQVIFFKDTNKNETLTPSDFQQDFDTSLLSAPLKNFPSHTEDNTVIRVLDDSFYLSKAKKKKI